MGHLREAVEAASHVIRENASNAKAYFRRAQAYRLLDEYESAEEDLRRCKTLTPLDKDIARESKLLQVQRANANRKSKVVAAVMMGTASSTSLTTLDGPAKPLDKRPPLAEAATATAATGAQGPSLLFNIGMPLEPLHH